MNNHDSIFPADKMVGDARLHVETCRDGLRDLLAKAQARYKEIISRLDALSANSPEGETGQFAARLETLRRSQFLNHTAGEFDVAISRLGLALSCVEQALGALEGHTAPFSLSHKPSDASLEAVAIQAQEQERYRLAREIHDGPAQILANVALQLEYISKLATRDPTRARDELSTIQKDLRLALGEVRRFMYDLRPPALAQQGVGPAVESHCQRLAERFGMRFHVRWMATSTLSPSHDTAVFRIIQEALQNVMKHAQATQVEVQAMEREGFLEITVKDNGKGFEPERVHDLDPKHFGLAGMRARAQQIGATLTITSVPNRSTTVLIRVPLGAV